MGASSREYLAQQERDEAAKAVSAELLWALRRAQAALAMLVSPEKIVATTVASAWANAVQAEALARAAIKRAEAANALR